MSMFLKYGLIEAGFQLIFVKWFMKILAKIGEK